ncbi:Hypothetical protein R9X50_00755800 [Acrodontium crateriforme]|uniref:MAPEG family protein n=1 Tax=Acrodontium crateriforme TaxID=150365 RepID=A0AAQ3RCT5_9PEZI|nr:Hypothetical protein R9X50_00755800 [Acrodontium crateriforme]
MSYNLPLLLIPAYYALAILPHGYALVLATQGNPARHDNRNPKSSSLKDGLKKKLSAKEYAAWERAESCHRNHLENMPLFVATVFAGILAEQQSPGANAAAGLLGLNSFCTGWMAIRVLYTLNYLTAETQFWSYLRSVLYFAGTFWAFGSIGKAALALGP